MSEALGTARSYAKKRPGTVCPFSGKRFLSLPFSSAVLGILCVWSAAAEEVRTQPILVLDAGGHTSTVRKVLFTPDGKEVVTVSEDKTARRWDAGSGQPLGVLRPPIGRGFEGRLLAAAISPDGHTLAVGGFGFPDRAMTPIYLIRLSTGGIDRVLTGHSRPILELAFAPDGRQLASCGYDKAPRLWDVETGRCVKVLEGHSEGVTSLAFSPDGKRLATAGFDRTARIWSLEGGRVEAALTESEEVWSVAWSRDGRTIATGTRDQSIHLWNADGTSRQRLTDLGNGVMSVSFAADGRNLLATLGGARVGSYYACLFDPQSGQQRVRFTGHTNSVYAGAFSPDGTMLATTGGHDCETYLWSAADGAVTQRLVGRGRRVWNCGWSADGRQVLWGNTLQEKTLNIRGPLERAFDLTSLEFVAPSGRDARRAVASQGPLRLQALDPSHLAVRQAESTLATIELDRKSDGRLLCYSFLGPDHVVVGTTAHLRLYDARTGKCVRRYLGHTGDVWAVAVSPDGRHFVSASVDQTLRVWEPQREDPLVSLFFAGEEWIVWTPEGYYAASPGGERLIGWQVNNGLEQMASYFPAAQFRKSLYRPDVIRLILQTGNTTKALAVADPGGGRAVQLTRADDILPPEVTILAPGPSPVQVDQPRVDFRAKATPRGRDPITALRLLVDGRPAGEVKQALSPAQPMAVEESWTVLLQPGVHQVVVKAETGKSYGLSQPVEVTCASKESEQELPSLYVLAVGISNYQNETLRLAYGAADARGLTETLQKKAAGVYRKVEANLILDGEATQRNILRGLDWLRKQMTQRDVGLVFFAGHGAKDDQGAFYLLPSDCKPDELAVAGVGEDQIKRFCQSIPGRLILLLDACHTGALGGDRRRAIGGLTDNLVRDLISDDYGLVVMCSSMGREESREQDDWGHGAFTKALIEGLEGQADYNRDRSIYLNELDLYVAERVKELTGGHQHPVTQKPTSIRNFPLTRP